MPVCSALRALFFPPRCPFCGEMLPFGSEQALCPACEKRLRALQAPALRRLGPSGKLCCLTAFRYEGEVRERLVEMKARVHRGHARAFAPFIAQLAARSIPGIGQLAVTCVPGYEPQGRVYNAARVLARDTARALQLPFLPDALCLPREKRRQHTLDIRQRWENVEGTFFPGGEPVAGRRVLLIDDIATTGATLCACARALAAAGAEEVVCAAAASPAREQARFGKEREGG